MTLITLFILSLISSTHCAAMCGGFVTFYSAEKASSTALNITYNLGRLCTYLMLGALASIAGCSLNKIGYLAGLSQLATTLIGSIFIIWGLNQFFDRPWRFINIISERLHKCIFYSHNKLANTLKNKGALLKTFILGLSSTLLPCGLLYSFAAAAGSSGSLKQSLIVMFIFWLGTLPILLSIAILSKKILQRWSLENSKIIAPLLIVAGLFALSGHLGVPSQHIQGDSYQCH